jgi:hypothetical protein
MRPPVKLHNGEGMKRRSHVQQGILQTAGQLVESLVSTLICTKQTAAAADSLHLDSIIHIPEYNA